MHNKKEWLKVRKMSKNLSCSGGFSNSRETYRKLLHIISEPTVFLHYILFIDLERALCYITVNVDFPG